MVDGRMRTLVERLLAQTRDQNLRWKEGAGKNQFVANFAMYSVKIALDDNRSYDDVYLQVINGKGIILESVYQNTSQSHYDSGKLNDQLGELYSQARRQALHIDEALDELLNQVG